MKTHPLSHTLDDLNFWCSLELGAVCVVHLDRSLHRWSYRTLTSAYCLDCQTYIICQSNVPYMRQRAGTVIDVD